MPSDAMEDYLKAVYELRESPESPVGTSELADHVGVTPPTATSMLESLEDRGLVTREKYRGTRLTPEGETVALEVVRHHRLLETFLTEFLDYCWSEVHEEADRLEHHVSDRLEERIAAALDDPETDPHGDPIPGPDLTSPREAETQSLAAREAGDRVVVARVRDREEAELRYLAESGIEPGRELHLREVTPVGTYVVGHDDGVYHLPESVAETIRVREAGPSEDASGEVTRA